MPKNSQRRRHIPGEHIYPGGHNHPGGLNAPIPREPGDMEALIYGLGILLDEDMRSGAEEIKCTITVTRHKDKPHSIDCEVECFPSLGENERSATIRYKGKGPGRV